MFVRGRSHAFHAHRALDQLAGQEQCSSAAIDPRLVPLTIITIEKIQALANAAFGAAPVLQQRAAVEDLSMRLTPANFPFSVTVQSPTQKSNCRDVSAAQGSAGLSAACSGTEGRVNNVTASNGRSLQVMERSVNRKASASASGWVNTGLLRRLR
jgi:hypothetical protein